MKFEIEQISPTEWIVLEGKYQRVAYIERRGISECEIREYEKHHTEGRGRLLMVFLGREALQQAYVWIENELSIYLASASKKPPTKMENTSENPSAKMAR